MQSTRQRETDDHAIALIGPSNFNTSNIVWSSTSLDRLWPTKGFSGVMIYFTPSAVPGGLTGAEIYAQYYPDTVTIPLSDDSGDVLTDFLINAGTDGTFNPLDYRAKPTVAGGTLVAGKTKSLYYPNRGNRFRVGIKGVGGAGGAGFRVDALRIW